MLFKIVLIAIICVVLIDATPMKSNPVVDTPPGAYATSLGPCVDILRPGINYKIAGCSYYSATEHCKENPGDPAVSFPGCCPTFSCPFSTSPAVAKAK